MRKTGITDASSSESTVEDTTSLRRARSAARRHVTVVQCTCNVYESAEILETLDFDEQNETLEKFQNLCTEVVKEYEGIVVQPTDQGLLACFGYPMALEDATSRAVSASLKICSRMEPFNEQLNAKMKVRLGARFAVHSDTAIVEDTGEGDTLSLVGPIRNVVSQLVSLTDLDTVVISDTTLRLIEGHFDCQPKGSHQLKGIAEPMLVYHVESQLTVRSRIKVASQKELTPLIGRDREVGLLEDRWEQAVEGMGQVVLLIGEAGLGKSRLVDVLSESVSAQCTGNFSPLIEWRCAAHRRNSSLFPVTECFGRILAFDRTDSPSTRLDKLSDHLKRLDLDGPEEIALLASLLSIPLADDFPRLELSPQEQKQATLDLLMRWLYQYATLQPVLFIVEDLHWIDPSTLQFLEKLIDQGFNNRILTLLTFRPEFETPWKSKAHQTQVALNRLTKKQVGEMMARKSGLEKIPKEIVDQIVERTDGVPLFIEEFTSMILDTNSQLQFKGGVTGSQALPAHAIPTTLQDLLMARLDRMAGNFELAQLASAIGREFDFELIAAVSDLDEAKLMEELSKLVASELLYQQGHPPHARYQFKHALIQDAAYNSLIIKKRKECHQRIAEAIEGKFADTLERQPELLAQHFTEASMHTKAIDYWELAGNRSLEMYAYVEAIEQLSRVLELLERLPDSEARKRREINTLISLGVPLQSVKGYSAPEVRSNYARAQLLCQQLDDETEQFPVLYGLFRYYLLQAQYGKARGLGQKLMDLSSHTDNLNFVVAANRAIGSPLVYQAQHEKALTHLNAVIAIEATDELRAQSYAYDVVDPWIASHSYMSWSLWLCGYPEQARAQSDRAIQTAEKLKHPFSIALALDFAQWLHQFNYNVAGVRETVDKAMTIATERHYAFWIGWSRVLGGWAMACDKPSNEAIKEIREGIDHWRAQGSWLGCSYFYALLAEACAKYGKIDRGLAALDDGLGFANSSGETYYLPEIIRLQGELLLQQGMKNVDSAEGLFIAAIEQAQEQGARSLELRASTSLAQLWKQQDRSPDAHKLLVAIYDWFTEGFDTHDLKQAKALIDALS